MVKCPFCSSRLDAREISDIVVDIETEHLLIFEPPIIKTLYQCQNPDCKQVFVG